MGEGRLSTDEHRLTQMGREEVLTAKKRKQAAGRLFRRDGTLTRKIRKSANGFASFRLLLVVLFSLVSYLNSVWSVYAVV